MKELPQARLSCRGFMFGAVATSECSKACLAGFSNPVHHDTACPKDLCGRAVNLYTVRACRNQAADYSPGGSSHLVLTAGSRIGQRQCPILYLWRTLSCFVDSSKARASSELRPQADSW